MEENRVIEAREARDTFCAIGARDREHFLHNGPAAERRGRRDYGLYGLIEQVLQGRGGAVGSGEKMYGFVQLFQSAPMISGSRLCSRFARAPPASLARLRYHVSLEVALLLSAVRSGSSLVSTDLFPWPIPSMPPLKLRVGSGSKGVDGVPSFPGRADGKWCLELRSKHEKPILAARTARRNGSRIFGGK